MKHVVIAWFAVTVSFDANAHHAFAGYDRNNLLTIDGQITQVLWRNPHVTVTIERVLENGSREIWEAKGEALNSVLRAGVERSDIVVGDQVSLFGAMSRNEENSMAVYTLTPPSGTQLILWPRRVVELGMQVPAAPIASAKQVESAQVAKGIFRVWARETGGVWASDAPLTSAARLARDSFDSLQDDPALQCIPPGMPSIMDNPFPVEFVDAGDHIFLRLEMWDRVRTVHLAEDAPNAGEGASPLGYSLGYWDGRTLIVETKSINDPYFDWAGTPQTEAIEVMEWFTLNVAEDRLNYRSVITDPATFTEPATLTGSWAWTPGEEVKPYECALTE
jgi:hypothetical protein